MTLSVREVSVLKEALRESPKPIRARGDHGRDSLHFIRLRYGAVIPQVDRELPDTD